MEETKARKPSKEELLAKREQAIRLLKQGTPVMKIVEECGLSWPAVNTAIKLYKAGGKLNLEPKRRGRKQGTGRALSEEQENELRNILYEQPPWRVKTEQSSRNVKLSLWNRDAVTQLIHERCKVKLSVRGVAKYLQRWGFPLMKKNQRPRKRCTIAIQQWLDEHYESLDRRYKAEKAEIYWVSRKPLVIGNDLQGNRWPKRLSMISAIDNHGKEHWLIVKGNYTQEKQLIFLRALVNLSKAQVILIRTNSDHYTDESVVDWISKNSRKIESCPPLLPNEAEMKKAAQRRAEILREELRIERAERQNEWASKINSGEIRFSSPGQSESVKIGSLNDRVYGDFLSKEPTKVREGDDQSPELAGSRSKDTSFDDFSPAIRSYLEYRAKRKK